MNQTSSEKIRKALSLLSTDFNHLEAIDLLKAAAKQQETDAYYWLGVTYFLNTSKDASYKQEAKLAFTNALEQGDKSATFWLALTNYPDFSVGGQATFPQFLALMEEAYELQDNYAAFWLALSYLQDKYIPSNYYLTWDYLSAKRNMTDVAQYELIGHMMTNQGYIFDDITGEADINQGEYWLNLAHQAKDKAPNPFESKEHAKAYINWHYAQNLNLDNSTIEEMVDDTPSPYRGISIIIGVIFFIILALLAFFKL